MKSYFNSVRVSKNVGCPVLVHRGDPHVHAMVKRPITACVSKRSCIEEGAYSEEIAEASGLVCLKP